MQISLKELFTMICINVTPKLFIVNAVKNVTLLVYFFKIQSQTDEDQYKQRNTFKKEMKEVAAPALSLESLPLP